MWGAHVMGEDLADGCLPARRTMRSHETAEFESPYAGRVGGKRYERAWCLV